MRRWVWKMLLTAVMMTLLAGTAMAAEVTVDGVKYDTAIATVLGPVDKAKIVDAKIKGTVDGVTITTIASNAFNGCTQLKTVQIEKNITTIGDSAFNSCQNLETVLFPDSVGGTGIEAYAFANCGKLNQVVLPPNLTDIKTGTFANCHWLTSIYIANVTNIDLDAFAGSGVKFLHCDKPDTVNQADTTSPLGVHRASRAPGLRTEPDCTNPGKQAYSYTCSVCTSTFNFNQDEPIEALGHKPGALIPKVEPTCSIPGTEEGTRCTVCNAITSGLEEIPVNPTAHDSADLEAVDAVPATCTEPGWTAGERCKACGKYTTEPTEVKALDHDFGSGATAVPEKETITKEPTCTEEGEKEITKQCTRCKEDILIRTEPIPKELHVCTTKTTEYEIIKANCSHKGYTVTYKVCDTCGSREECVTCENIEKKLAEHPDQELTGDEVEHLRDAHEGLVEVEITANHTRPENVNSTVTLEPNCTTPGTRVYDSYKCTLCGKEIKDITELTEEIAPLGHDFEAGAPVTTAPTCTQPGIVTVTHTCTRKDCDGEPGDDEGVIYGKDSEGRTFFETEEPVEATGHKWGDFTVTSVITEPTCVAGKAVGTAKCTVCSVEESGIEIELEPVSAHTYGEWTVEDGKRVRVCTVCGNKQSGGDVAPEDPDTPTDPDNPTDPDTPTDPDKPTDPDRPTTPTTYSINMISTKNGSVTASVYSARPGDVVTLTVRPNSGYELDWLRVSLASTGAIRSLDGLGGGQYRFTMPAGNVEVRAAFTETYVPSWSNGSAITSTGATSRWTDPAQTVVQGVPRAGTNQQIFSDIPASHWAAGEINWASNMGYMSGSRGRFNPDGTITFQQMWMVLARLSGSRPGSMEEARNWAVLNGFAEGGNPTHTVARHQLVTALYRCAHILGSTNHRTASLAGYPDSRTVPAVARDPMAWAVANGIVGGNANGRLDPFGTLTRAQFAVVLYRFSQRI